MGKIKTFITSSVIARIITAILSLLALFDHQIGYYKFLRWVVFITAIYIGYISFNKKPKFNLGIWLFGMVALLFNPIVPFYLGNLAWKYADLVVALIFLGSIFFIREEQTLLF